MGLRDQSASLAIVTILLLCLSIVVVSLRCWVRISINFFRIRWLVNVYWAGKIILSHSQVQNVGEMLMIISIFIDPLHWDLYSNHHRLLQWDWNTRYTSNASTYGDCAQGNWNQNFNHLHSKSHHTFANIFVQCSLIFRLSTALTPSSSRARLLAFWVLVFCKSTWNQRSLTSQAKYSLLGSASTATLVRLKYFSNYSRKTDFLCKCLQFQSSQNELTLLCWRCTSFTYHVT
jgi:hypothetical protein